MQYFTQLDEAGNRLAASVFAYFVIDPGDVYRVYKVGVYPTKSEGYQDIGFYTLLGDSAVSIAHSNNSKKLAEGFSRELAPVMCKVLGKLFEHCTGVDTDQWKLDKGFVEAINGLAYHGEDAPLSSLALPFGIQHCVHGKVMMKRHSEERSQYISAVIYMIRMEHRAAAASKDSAFMDEDRRAANAPHSA